MEPVETVATVERYRGCLLGLAAGDAVGTAVEFAAPGSFPPVEDMVGGWPFGLRPGQWTDDTSLALCLAESLVTCGGFDPVDQLRRYVRWWREGHWSSTGQCFDIGNTTRTALECFERGECREEPWCGSTSPRSAGNGSLMRLAPVPMAYAENPALAVRLSGESSRTTHGAAEAVEACRYLGALIVGALRGAPKERLTAPWYEPAPGLWEAHPLTTAVARVAGGSFLTAEPPAIRGTGHAVASLEAALWALHRTGSFRDGCPRAVNLGDDADTTAAVYGQLAGAHFGESAIPPTWRGKLARAGAIRGLAESLHALARGSTPGP